MPAALEIAIDLKGKAGDAAYVNFYTTPKELVRRSEAEGRYIAIDVDMVEVRQKGATDSVKFEVPLWLKQNNIDMKAGRLPMEHAAHYEKMYAHWKAGQELPVEGTPIKGWAVIAPSQAEAIIRAGIRTVEDLSNMNGEAMQRIGMGAVMLKNKAQAWVAQAQDKGPLTMEMAELKRQNDLLKLQLETQGAQIAALQEKRPQVEAVPPSTWEPEDAIVLKDILDTATTPPKRSHHKKEA